MEYFDLKNDWDEIRALRSRKFDRILIISIAVIALAVSRGAGVLNVEWANIYLGAEETSIREIPPEIRKSWNITTTTSKDSKEAEISTWTVGANTSFGDLSELDLGFQNDQKQLETVVKTRLREKGFGEFSNVSVMEISTSGLFYWVPLAKRGTITYKIFIDEVGNGRNYAGTYEGTYNFNAFGICSISQLRKSVVSSIADSVVAKVKDDLKK